MNTQKVIVEKDPSPMRISKPWRYRCTEGVGPFKPHMQGGFKTKTRALEVAQIMTTFINESIENKKS